MLISKKNTTLVGLSFCSRMWFVWSPSLSGHGEKPDCHQELIRAANGKRPQPQRGPRESWETPSSDIFESRIILSKNTHLKGHRITKKVNKHTLNYFCSKFVRAVTTVTQKKISFPATYLQRLEP